METYLVGGAVRDRLLGKESADRDYVVIGASEADMLRDGYTRVGKDFPVFLHPQTHEEYALARTERKTGQGHQGFACVTEGVTLSEDLARRDLTINALAMDDAGNVIDPWGGVDDLNGRRLRHVSDAFSEDPLRVLRVARFLARFGPDGFTVHASTLELMHEIARSGELESLPAERVFAETEKALGASAAHLFFSCLGEVGALDTWFKGADSNLLAQHEQAIDQPLGRFAVLLSTTDAQDIAAVLKAPREYRDLAVLVQSYHKDFAALDARDPSAVLDLTLKADGLRRTGRLTQFARICTALVGGNGATLLACATDAMRGLDNRTITANASNPVAAIAAARATAVSAALADLGPADAPG